MCDFTSVVPRGDHRINAGDQVKLQVLPIGDIGTGTCIQIDAKNFLVEDIRVNLKVEGNSLWEGTINKFHIYFENEAWNFQTETTPHGEASTNKTYKNISSSESPDGLHYKGTYDNDQSLEIKQSVHLGLHFDGVDISNAGIKISEGLPTAPTLIFKKVDIDALTSYDGLLEADDYAIIPHHHDELGDHAVQLRLESEFGYAVLKNPDPATLQMIMHAFSFDQPVFFSRKKSLYHPIIQLIKIGEGRH